MKLIYNLPAVFGAIIIATLFLDGASTAFAENAPAKPGATQSMEKPTKEMREKMAALHEKMATCLRSDKDITECRSEMHKACEEAMGGEHCSMMTEMMEHHHHSMPKPATTPATTEGK